MTATIAITITIAVATLFAWSLGGPGDGTWAGDEWADYRCD